MLFEIYFYIFLVFFTVFTSVLVGKFFCVSYIEDWYDCLTNEFDGVLFGIGCIAYVFSVLYVPAYVFNWEFISKGVIVFGSLFLLVAVIMTIALVFMMYIIPGLENLHSTIKYRKQGRR